MFSRHEICGVYYFISLIGDLVLWDIYISKSNVLIRLPGINENQRPVLDLKTNCEIVFGGNISGKGSGDIRIMREILSLKHRYPSRVHIILGGNEVNRLRLPFELTDHMLYERPTTFFGSSEDNVDVDAAFRSFLEADQLSERAQWILTETMNSRDSFENRRNEIHDLGFWSIDSQYVAQTYIDLMAPEDGLQDKYLSKGLFATIVADTLFVHNALALRYKGYVPPYNGKSVITNLNVRDWVVEMNAFAARQINEFGENMKIYSTITPTDCWIKEGGYSHDQPGSKLVNFYHQCDIDDKRNFPMPYSRRVGKEEQIFPFDDSVCAWLAEGNITQIIAGHQSVGDFPGIMELPHKIKLILANTTDTKRIENKLLVLDDVVDHEASIHGGHAHTHKYATVVDKNISVGNTACELILTPSATCFESNKSKYSSVNYMILIDIYCSTGCKIFANGTLSDGTNYLLDIPEHLSRTYIGSTSNDGWTVKTILPDLKYYLLSKYISDGDDNYHFANIAVPKDAITPILHHGIPEKSPHMNTTRHIQQQIKKV